MTLGPVQLLIIGFDDPQIHGEIRAALATLRENDIIRLIDAVVINKDHEGNVEILHQSDLSVGELTEVGAYVGALLGLGMDGEEGAEIGAQVGAEEFADGSAFDDEMVWYAADVIPNGTAAAAALLEHRWAIPLRTAITNAGGAVLADAWIRPVDLVAVGLLAAAETAPV
jgi:uncharacterized membrane protein